MSVAIKPATCQPAYVKQIRFAASAPKSPVEQALETLQCYADAVPIKYLTEDKTYDLGDPNSGHAAWVKLRRYPDRNITTLLVAPHQRAMATVEIMANLQGEIKSVYLQMIAGRQVRLSSEHHPRLQPLVTQLIAKVDKLMQQSQ